MMQVTLKKTKKTFGYIHAVLGYAVLHQQWYAIDSCIYLLHVMQLIIEMITYL